MRAWDGRQRNHAIEPAKEGILRINTEIEQATGSYLLTEDVVERCWLQTLRLKSETQSYWLLLVRLAESALLCAGNYADSGAYAAAGDLLVNPREILVRHLIDGRTSVKNRHETLSKQFGFECDRRRRSIKRFSAGVCLEISKPPLLPLMERVLMEAGCISPFFLQRLAEGQCRIADTLTFLAAWGIFDTAELWRRLQTCTEKERVLIESNLCRFDTRIFAMIGSDLRRSLGAPVRRSVFLTTPSELSNTLEHTSALTALKLLASPA